MRLGMNVLERHRFAAITVEDTTRRLIMRVDDLRLRDVWDGKSLLHRPLRPSQVFQPRQRFVIGILFP